MGEQTAKAPGLNRAKTYQLVLFPLLSVSEAVPRSMEVTNSFNVSGER